MTSAQRRFKLITSIPVSTLLYGLPFGGIMATTPKGKFVWPIFFISSPIFGLIMAITMKRQYSKMPGIARSDNDWLLVEHFRKGTLPQDPVLLEAMPTYIEKSEQQLYASRKSLPTAYLIGALGFMYGLSTKSILMLVCGVVILTIMTWSVISMQKTAKRIEKLRRDLSAKASV